jgi:hypothetical protein
MARRFTFELDPVIAQSLDRHQQATRAKLWVVSRRRRIDGDACDLEPVGAGSRCENDSNRDSSIVVLAVELRHNLAADFGLWDWRLGLR